MQNIKRCKTTAKMTLKNFNTKQLNKLKYVAGTGQPPSRKISDIHFLVEHVSLIHIP